MQNNILNKLKKIIIMFLTAIILMQSVSFADFTPDQQEAIKKFVYQVKEMNTAYTIDDTRALEMGYQLKESKGYYNSNGHGYSRRLYMVMLCYMGISNI